jgi:phage gp36-like protein
MYCFLDDIKNFVDSSTLIQLTDDNQAGEIDSNIVDEAIIYSETLIDGYLRGRYSLPLVETPKIISFIALDLSIYRLYSRRLATDMPESINEKYKVAIKVLEQIQKGIISIGLETKGNAPELGEYRGNKTFQDREFSKDKLNAY